ncbi:MAG TPA: hypothetical protein VGB82_08595 [Alphaproteobacteria bacterium]
MRKTISMLGLGLGLLLSHPLPASAQAPDAVIELSGGSAAAGIGYSWGHGTLIFHGKRYPVTVSGFSLASVGVDEYTATGSVVGLKRVQDINGVYTAASAGATVAGGASATAMENQNGVTIHMTSTTEGLNLTLAAEGVQIALAH